MIEPNLNLNVENIEKLQILLPASSGGFAAGAEMERRIMKNMRLEKWASEEGEFWKGNGFNTPSKYIAVVLLGRGYDSLENADLVESYLLRLVGWGDHQNKPGRPAPFDQERNDKNSPLREEYLVVHRIMTAWKRLFDEKGEGN